MAYYAALTTLANLVEDILLHNRYPDFLLSKHPVMESLHENLNFLEESLKGYSSKGDEANDRVERMIQDAAHQAQDIIEFQILDHVNQQSMTSEKKKYLSFVLLFLVQRKQIVKTTSTEKSVDELHIVNRKIVSILDAMKIIKETQANEDLRSGWDSFDTNILKRAPIDRNVITVGLDEYLITIKDQLCGHTSNLVVIPIVGTGGIGKTTLAKCAYDDSLVVYHFDRRAWVVASQDFNVVQFLQTIAKSLGLTDALHRDHEEVLKEKIYKQLKGRRYLVVIDDIWSTKVWDDVKRIFPNDDNGSRIILTTRLLDVAEYASAPDFLHEMQLLNDDQSWNLLQQKVFGEQHCPSELEDTGKLIARYCCGLPLAIAVIAGVLSTKMILHEWKNVASRVREILRGEDEQFSKILSLSYHHLSHQLKACFLYMGSFPEDHEINISKLSKLWVAEGFLKSSDRTKTLEEVAAECLMDLAKRNLVIITKKRSNGEAKLCVLHDLLMDFCWERALHENFFHTILNDSHMHPEAEKDVRHLNWYYTSRRYRPSRKIDQHWPLLRSIHLFPGELEHDFLFSKWANFKLLRVFDEFRYRFFVADTRVTLFQLFNLKYAGFDKLLSMFRFPSMFMAHQSLQSLIIDRLYTRIDPLPLPPEIWKMSQLRHLIVFPAVELPPVPQDVDKLECLQTLMTVCNFTFTDEAIQVIPNLIKLKVIFPVASGILHGWDNHTNLFNLSRLEELKLQALGPSTDQLPTKFAFPLNLRKLSLKGCRLPWKHMTLVGSLPHLQVLRLEKESFVGEEWEPKENEFACLKHLLMERLDLKYWRAEETHFPCLQHLEIRRCNNLEMIPLEIGDILALNVIKVFENGHALGDSAISIQEEQRNQGNEGLQVYIEKQVLIDTIGNCW